MSKSQNGNAHMADKDLGGIFFFIDVVTACGARHLSSARDWTPYTWHSRFVCHSNEFLGLVWTL